MKASSGDSFGIWRKYEGMTDLVLAYVWRATTSAPRFFLMTYLEAADLVRSHHNTDSWKKKDGGWYWSKVPTVVRDEIVGYENRWDWLHKKLDLARQSRP